MTAAAADTAHGIRPTSLLAGRIAECGREPTEDGSIDGRSGQDDSEPDRLLVSVLADVDTGDFAADETIIDEGEVHEYAESGGLTVDDIRNLTAVLGHKVSANTRKNYRSQWRRFAGWARDKGVNALPADPVQMAAYLAERIEHYGHRPATLHTAAAAISFVHRARGLADPRDTEEVRNTLRSATRKSSSSQKQAEGITEQELQAIRATACTPRNWRGGRMESVDAAEHRGRLDIAIIGVMRDALLRVSEAAALLWEDIEQEEDGTGRLLIRRSKTDAEGEGAVAFLSVPTMESLEVIRSVAPAEDRVFGLRPNRIARRIKEAARAAGLGEGFSGHSPRVGMARDLARTGTELTRLMTAGRWRSPRMPALYTRNETVARGAVAQFYGSRSRYFRRKEGRVESAKVTEEHSNRGGIQGGCGGCRTSESSGRIPQEADSTNADQRMRERGVTRIRALIHALHFMAESIAKSLLRPALLLNCPLCIVHSA